MKKDVAYYMSLKYRMEILQDEEGFTVRFPDLPGCLTCGETIEEALKNAEDAKKCWFTAAIKDCRERIKEPDDDTYSGQFRLRMPKTLHRQLAERANEQGVSMNQYCCTILAQNA